MPKRFLIFIPPKDFRDESLSLVKLFFDKWGVNYHISSYTSNECIGMHGAAYMPHVHTAKASVEDYDGVVLIDGKGVESYKLHDYRPLLDLLLRFNGAGKSIVAIDGAVKIPARANIIRDKRVTVDDTETIRLVTLFHGLASSKEFEISNNLITIKGPKEIEGAMPAILEHIGVA